MATKPSASAATRSSGLLVACLLFTAVLVVLFRAAFLPGHVIFSNDGPLGQIHAQFRHLPEAFSGAWNDLNSVGLRDGAWPSITFLEQWLLGPVGYSKFCEPIGLLLLGLGAWCFFRQLRFAPVACLLGGLAAMLNSAFFSAACWGLASHAITVGMAFLALAALVDTVSPRRWLRAALGGLAVGMAVMEGADIGALFSLGVAAFVAYQALTTNGSVAKNLATGIGRLVVVTGCALLLAGQTVSVLVTTQIQGVAGAEQSPRARARNWDWATQWSLPKREALGLLIPGLFGYRMDTPAGGNYWGAAGRAPAWDRYFEAVKKDPNTQPPDGFLRHTGGGNYAGVLVGLVAVWAAIQGLRPRESVFTPPARRWLWFWSAVAVMSLVLAFGRFAPAYRWVYSLPYSSVVRNPAKFIHLFSWALVILFGYGVQGLWQQYLEAAKLGGTSASFAVGWRQGGFERRWTLGCVVVLGASVVAWAVYDWNREALETYLRGVGFSDDAFASAIAGFSIARAGWFLVWFAGAAGLVTLILSGALRGPRARWGGVLLGLFLVADLGRANLPWIADWDYEVKYQSNAIVDLLRDKPHEHRVAAIPFRAPPEYASFTYLFQIEWLQHLFPYYDIQSLDVVQMPREAADLEAFRLALELDNSPATRHKLTRRWQLTNTRFLLGAAGFQELLNTTFDPVEQRCRIRERFELAPKPEVVFDERNPETWTAKPATNGNYALFEFTGALPRAKLFSNWQVNTNDAVWQLDAEGERVGLYDSTSVLTNGWLADDSGRRLPATPTPPEATLNQLASPEFDPARTVLVRDSIPAPPGASQTNRAGGSVEFVSYSPKQIRLKAVAESAAVLLLNDHYDPNWKARVDGQPTPLLRCNYLMRGVYLDPGAHQVEFLFQPPMTFFYVSLAALGAGVVLCGRLFAVRDSPVPGHGHTRRAKAG